MDELDFWRTCCERGITVCTIPKPMKEELTCWLVVKYPTFKDRKPWTASLTFDSIDDVRRAVERYILMGDEPLPAMR
jgi:hypothetical protein